MYSVPVKNYYGEEQRMDESREIEYLMHFGLSRQEALIYRKLLEGGKKTGYEIARDTGISRSNAYASLAAMVEKGAAYLHQMLAEVDPKSAEVIHENNTKRVIRALEFYHQNHSPISAHNEEQQERTSPYNLAYFVLNAPRELLY